MGMISKIFGNKPKPPKLPPIISPEFVASQRLAEDKRRKQAGFASTILTEPGGLTDTAVSQTTLLGS